MVIISELWHGWEHLPHVRLEGSPDSTRIQLEGRRIAMVGCNVVQFGGRGRDFDIPM